jgi:hypothetical protein
MKPASFSLLTGRPRKPSSTAAAKPSADLDREDEQQPDGDTAETTACLLSLKEQIDGLTSAITARMDTMEASMRAIADKPTPTISVPPPAAMPPINIPPMPSYKKELDQINKTLGVLIARATPPATDTSPPPEISFDVLRNGLGDVVSVIARKSQ